MHARAEILVRGLVQGVGFRYFVVREAEKIGVKGFVQNLYSGEVLIVAEAERSLLEEFLNKVKVGPIHASVKSFKVDWLAPKNEFETFGIKF